MDPNRNRKKPRPERRNDAKHIDYDATPCSSSLDDDSSSTSSLLMRDLSDKSSFRVEGNEADFDRICRELGLSGPKDFGIDAAAWEFRKLQSSDLLPRSQKRFGLKEGEEEIRPAIDIKASRQLSLGNYLIKRKQNTVAFTNNLTDDLSRYYIHRPPSEFPYCAKASLLRELDCSDTNIKFLPESLPALVALDKLILKRCQLFMELPPQVGELPNLEMLDLDETEILSLPQEIGRLSKLKFLRVSFYGCKNRGKKLQENALIHPGTISTLSQLADLSINVNPDDERWYAVVEDVIEEAFSLETLRSLTLYVPNAEIFGKHKAGSTSLICYPLHKFRFTIGQHKQRIISRVPKKIEAQFQKWERSLKFIKGRDIPGEIKSVLKCATAFYLDRHAIATSLSDFGIEDLQMLEFCLLEECDQIETIIDGSGEESSKLPVEPFSLQYLHVYHLKRLVTIWRNPSPDLRLFSGLKFLALHKCPKLSVILSVSSFANLNQLEVLIVEDCPQVTCIVSPTCDATFSSIGLCLLPNLKTILLLYLPNLTTISSGFHIAPQLKSMGVYNCPKLESIYIDVISSDHLEVIKGEKKWWEALKWGNSEWETKKVDYLHSIFSPIQRERDVMSQMEEIIDT